MTRISRCSSQRLDPQLTTSSSSYSFHRQQQLQVTTNPTHGLFWFLYLVFFFFSYLPGGSNGTKRGTHMHTFSPQMRQKKKGGFLGGMESAFLENWWGEEKERKKERERECSIVTSRLFGNWKPDNGGLDAAFQSRVAPSNSCTNNFSFTTVEAAASSRVKEIRPVIPLGRLLLLLLLTRLIPLLMSLRLSLSLPRYLYRHTRIQTHTSKEKLHGCIKKTRERERIVDSFSRLYIWFLFSPGHLGAYVVFSREERARVPLFLATATISCQRWLARGNEKKKKNGTNFI